MNKGDFNGLGIHFLHVIDQRLLDPIKRSFERGLDTSPGRIRIFAFLGNEIYPRNSIKITMLYQSIVNFYIISSNGILLI